MNRIPTRTKAGAVWLLFFCYSTITALMFQKLVIPIIPSLHTANGLMGNDAVHFHMVAKNIANYIHLNGLDELFANMPYGTSPNIFLLGFLYAVFGVDPSVIIPVNAALHASGGLLLILIGKELYPGKTGDYAGLITAIIFVTFPSALNWYGQLHKDGYSIAGLLLVLYSWIRCLNYNCNFSEMRRETICLLAGIALIAFARLYYLQLLFISGTASCLIVALRTILLTKSIRISKGFIVVATSLLLILFLTIIIKPQSANLVGSLYSEWQDPSGTWRWQRSEFVPGAIDRRLETAAKTRAGLIQYNMREKAAAIIDSDTAPASFIESLAYMPRALQIALFSPFPNRWAEKLSAMRIVSIMETSIWYCFIPGIAIAFYRRKLPLNAIVILLTTVIFFLAVFGFTSPNIGTLYRQRYVFQMLLILIGAIGWVDYFLSYREKSSNPPHPLPSVKPALAETTDSSCQTQSRTTLVNSGMLVMFLTFLGYGGFFLRDIVMARQFGVGNELDSFYIGMMLPMFLVTVVSIPFGQAIIPLFIEKVELDGMQAASGFASKLAVVITAFLFVICTVLYATSPYLISLAGWNFSPEKLVEARVIMLLFLPILLLSGLVITANSLLNAVGNYHLPGMAQLVVPVIAVLTLFVFGNSLGIKIVALAMAAGQILNLAIVLWKLNSKGITIKLIIPAEITFMRTLFKQYGPLILAAVLTSVALLVDNAIASSMPSGSVAALGLGSKLTLFMTGILGTGMAAVITPYFSSFMARKHLLGARQELSFLMAFVTVVLVPISLAIHLSAPNLIKFVFGKGLPDNGNLDNIILIMRLGILQLPFFTCNMLLVKFATAHKKTRIITCAAAFGLTCNIVLDFILVKFLSVAGIALATSMSMLVSAGVLLVSAHYTGHISWFDLFSTLLSWALYLTLIVCISFKSYSGIVVVTGAYLILLVKQIRILLISESMLPVSEHAA